MRLVTAPRELTMNERACNFPGSTGCQPVVAGSLPTTSNAVQKSRAMNVRWAFRQAAEKDRLAACAPQTPEDRRFL